MPDQLLNEHCQALGKGSPALDTESIGSLQSQTPDWTLGPNQASIRREFTFDNYHQTIAFVNAVAWIAHQEDHHPDMVVAYKTCEITYHTHSVGGLSRNDFICAAKIDNLIA